MHSKQFRTSLIAVLQLFAATAFSQDTPDFSASGQSVQAGHVYKGEVSAVTNTHGTIHDIVELDDRIRKLASHIRYMDEHAVASENKKKRILFFTRYSMSSSRAKSASLRRDTDTLRMLERKEAVERPSRNVPQRKGTELSIEEAYTKALLELGRQLAEDCLHRQRLLSGSAEQSGKVASDQVKKIER